MRSGLVSVIMPAFNAEGFIAKAIESLLQQSYTAWELIVINDGSTDRTAEMVSQFSDTRIKLFHQPNQGEGAARNAALDKAEGEYLAFLDADDAYFPKHLDVAVQYLQSHPKMHGVYTDGFYIDGEGNQIQTLSSRRRGPFQGQIFAEVVRGSDLFGPPVCVVLRREPILKHLLRYDTDIVIGPDWDFFVRYAEHASFGYLNQHTCLYRVHQTNITTLIKSDKRALELAKCRMKAVKLPGFSNCPIDVRAQVFYDLLVNLLRTLPQKQAEVVKWAQFNDLPAEQQAWILRIMASKAVSRGERHDLLQEWLRRSLELDPENWRSRLISGLYRVSPLFCQLVLQAKSLKQVDAYYLPPFADLQVVRSA